MREFNWNQQAQGGKILTINGRGCTIVGYKNDMGMALINVENELKAMGFTVKAVHNYYHYFTVENHTGAQVYCQVNDFGMGYDISIKHKPSRENGSGRQIASQVHFTNIIPVILDGFTQAEIYARNFGYPKSIRR